MNMKRCVIDVESEGLEPWKDRLICVGCRDTDSPKTKVFFSEDEKDLVNEFISYYNRKGFNEVIGFNVSFDLRFIFAKCLKYRIPAPKLFNSHFVDVMDNVKSIRRMYSYNKSGKLDDWLQYLFGIGKLEKGKSVKDMFEKREFTRIILYNRQDVNMTYELWKLIRTILCD